MITGVQYWNDRSHYYIQSNNPTEEILRKRSQGNWLVSCGPTAAVGCLTAMGHSVAIDCPGTYKPQSEEVLMDFFNDPRNYAALKSVRPEISPEIWHGNEIPQFYPVAVLAVFGVHAEFLWEHSLKKIMTCLLAGHAVQLSLISPSHYIAAVAYDSETQEIIFNDPWPGRFTNGDGFNRRLRATELEANTYPYMIVYGEKA